MNTSAEVSSGTGLSVTAIIPTYNRARYLREALSSVVEQTVPPTQVIVVDDGSQDNTREVVAEFGSRVEYIWKPNGGKSSALNLGLRHATGHLIWIFDDDDVAEPDALQRLMNALRERPDCGFAYGNYDCFSIDETGLVHKVRSNFPEVPDGNLLLAVLIEPFFIFQPGLLVRTSCYVEVGGFDETLIRSQDFEMLLRLAHRYSGVKVEGIVFHQRQHAGIRGSEASPVSAGRVLETWLKNEREVLRRIYETHDLQDFVPERSFGLEQPDEQKFTALLRRSCIMARKGVWNNAALDILQASEIAQKIQKRTLARDQEVILRRIFDLFSFAPHTFENAAEFRRALNEMKPAQLRRRIRAAILWPFPFTIGAVLLHRQYANFWKFLRIYFALATPDAVLRTVFTRSFFRAGTELVSNHRRVNRTRATL